MKPNTFFSFKTYIFVAIFIAFFTVLRWSSLNVPFERDEGEYAYSAWILKEGLAPYKDAFIQKPPMIIYTYLLSQLVNNDSFWPPRLIAAIFSLTTIVLIGLVAYLEFGKRAGLVAMLVSIPMFSLSEFAFLAANTEVFMLAPLMLLLFLYAWKKERSTFLAWFLAGITSAVAILYKPICVPIIAFIFLIWFLKTWRNNSNRLPAVLDVLWAIMGFVVATTVILLPIILLGGFSQLRESAFLFNFYYAKSYGLTDYFLKAAAYTLLWKWFFLLVFAAWTVKNIKKTLFYLCLLVIALASISNIPPLHYYLLLIPFLAILSGTAIVSFTSMFVSFKSAIKENLLLTLLTFTVLVTMLPSFKSILMSPAQYTQWVYPTEHFNEAPIVARQLSKITNPDDYVFVAGSEPEILFEAKRKSSSRFVITYPIYLDTPYRLQYQKETIDDLKNKPPSAIVYSNGMYTGLWKEGAPTVFIDYLRELLERDYILVGGYMRGLNEGWVAPINADKAGQTSFLLYKRKF